MLFAWMTLGLIVIITFVLMNYVMYKKVEKHVPQPLSAEDRKLCAKIVDGNLDYPRICSRAVDTGECPCLPCEKLEKVRRGELVPVTDFSAGVSGTYLPRSPR